MRQHLLDAWRTIAPGQDDPHGPLPPLLVLLTVVTGLVDAFSYLQLGRVFVANMTGNVVFLSFAVGGAPGFVWWASLLAVGTFVAGALLGGRVAHACCHHRGRHLTVAACLQGVLVAVATVLAFAVHGPYDDGWLALLIVVLGVAMGVQNATARALAVPDLTTTVLTLTLTGISADSAAAGGKGSRLGRRLVSIVSMFVGGLAGAALVEGGHAAWPLVIALVLLAVIAWRAQRTLRLTDDWTRRP